MLKSNKTIGHGAIKKLRTGAVVSVLSLTAFGSVVSADEVTKVGTSVTAEALPEVQFSSGTGVVTEDKPEFIADSKVLESARLEVVEAGTSLAEASGAVVEVENSIKAVEAEVLSVDRAIAEADNVTPEMLETAKAESASADKAYEVAKTANEEAIANESRLSGELALAEGTVATASAEVEKAEGLVSSARASVEALKGGADLVALEANVKTLESTVTSLEGTVSDLTKALELEKTLAKDKDKAIALAKEEVTKADSLVDGTALDLNAKTKALDEALSALESAKVDLESLNKYGEVPTLVIPSEYSTLIRRYFAEGRPSGVSEELSRLGLKAIHDNGFIGLNADSTYIDDPSSFTEDFYVPTKYEKSKAIDINNLDIEDKIELAKFTAALINQVRAAFGHSPIVANFDAMAISEVVTKLNTVEIGHDTNALYGAGEHYGLVYEEQGISAVSENVGYSDQKPKTLADLKHFAKLQVLNLMFQDAHSSWGHTLPIIDNLDVISQNNKYLGVSFGTTPSEEFSYLRMNFISSDAVSHAEEHNEPEESFDVDANFSYADDKALIDQAKAKVATAQTAYDKAKADTKKAETLYADAKASQTEARTTLSNIMNKVVDVAGAESKLDTAKQDLANAKSELVTAKEVLASASSSEAERAEALKVASAKLESAISGHVLASNALNRAVVARDSLSREYGVARTTLEGTRSALNPLLADKKAKAMRVDELAKALTDKESLLKDLNAKRTGLIARIDELKGELKSKNLTVEARKAKLAELEATYKAYLALAELQSKPKEDTSADKGTVSDVSVGGVVGAVEGTDLVKVGVVSQSETDISLVESKHVTPLSHQAYSRVEKNHLPKTGAVESIALTAMGTILSSIGLVGLKRKED